MKVITNLDQFKEKKPLALSLGMFDGVHLGHQSIISALTRIAKQKGLHAALLTFWPHPRLVFNPNDDLKLLNSLDEKQGLMMSHGIDYLFLKQFDEEFRNLTGEEFVRQVLVKKLNVKHLIVGHDHVFGKNKSGNFELLMQMSNDCGFEVQEMNALNIHDKAVSSTKIRTALEEGKIKEANEMLGYFYPISGKVVHGRKLGRTIGFPTANIEVDQLKLLPKKGAYIVEVYINNVFYKGMLSIGTNPTVNGEELSVEVYILDFDEDIYYQNIEVRFRDFLHEEIKFESLELLIDRLKEDERLTREFEF